MYCLDIWWNRKGFKWPNCKFHSPLYSRWWGLLAKRPLLTKGTENSPCSPQVAGFSALPALGIIQTTMTSSCENQGQPTLLILLARLFTSHLFTLHVTLRDTWCPPLPDCEDMWPLHCCWAHLCGAECWPSSWSQGGSPYNEANRRWLNRCLILGVGLYWQGQVQRLRR